jgi:hypothetical protein
MPVVMICREQYPPTRRVSHPFRFAAENGGEDGCLGGGSGHDERAKRG